MGLLGVVRGSEENLDEFIGSAGRVGPYISIPSPLPVLGRESPWARLSQHYEVCGKEDSTTGNCHVRVAFAANKPETAELLSRMAGEMAVHLEQRSYRRGRGGLLGSGGSISQQQTRRRLLTADEAMRLPPEDALIFLAGQASIRARKIRHYEDRWLAERAAVSFWDLDQ